MACRACIQAEDSHEGLGFNKLWSFQGLTFGTGYSLALDKQWVIILGEAARDTAL